MSRISPTPATVKNLFALSGNQCAFPGCSSPIVDSNKKIIGQICHIEAANEGGERYNPNQTDEERRSFENLILLCANHHIVTNDTEVYSVEALKMMKNNHESEFAYDTQQSVDEETIDKLISKHSHSLYFSPNNTGSGTQIVSYGLNYMEVKDLFSTLFESNFPKIRDIAYQTSCDSMTLFYEKFLSLFSENARNYRNETFQDPDFQFILCRSIESAARFDSENLRSILASILLKRIENSDSHLEKILYDEAISVAHKLSLNQLKILTSNFILSYLPFTLNTVSWSVLENHFNEKLIPFIDFHNVPADFQYSEYCGCSSVNHLFGAFSYAKKLKVKFENLFQEDMKSNPEDDVKEKLTLGRKILKQWAETGLWTLTLRPVGLVIVKAFYENYTGDKTFINIEGMFKEKTA